MFNQDLKDSISFAIKNMGEYFTAHNIIDFLIAREIHKIFYDEEIAKMKRKKGYDIPHAEQQLNEKIGLYLKRNASSLNIVSLGYLNEKLQNIHGTTSSNIGYYKRIEWGKYSKRRK